jgi:hypothetical protein
MIAVAVAGVVSWAAKRAHEDHGLIGFAVFMTGPTAFMATYAFRVNSIATPEGTGSAPEGADPCDSPGSRHGG